LPPAWLPAFFVGARFAVELLFLAGAAASRPPGRSIDFLRAAIRSTTLPPRVGASSFLRFDLAALQLQLALDQVVQRIDVAVVIFGRVEGTGLLLDQGFGEIEQILVRLGVANLAEKLDAFATSSA
jgi:hypothetical protein